VTELPEISEAARLRLEAAIWEQDARELVAQAAAPRDAVCLDACCGPAGALVPLAQAVPDGWVVGVDVDPALVVAARSHVRSRRLRNVEVMCGDVRHYHPRRRFDLVHVRFAPFSVGAEARRLIESLLRLCKPLGLVLLEEPCGPFEYRGAPSSALRSLQRMARIAYRVRGTDLDAGCGLAQRLREAGVEPAAEHRSRRFLPPHHPYLRLPLLLAESLSGEIIELGLASPAELKATIELAGREVGSPCLEATTFELVGVAGKAPAEAPIRSGPPAPPDRARDRERVRRPA
jgi:SAM-dependent methyltransferase